MTQYQAVFMLPCPVLTCISLQIRVYGMKYFDETAPYWGNSMEKIIRAGDNRLTVRSVKIVGDGEQLLISAIVVRLGVSPPTRCVPQVLFVPAEQR